MLRRAGSKARDFLLYVYQFVAYAVVATVGPLVDWISRSWRRKSER
jgi:hypothetical protein